MIANRGSFASQQTVVAQPTTIVLAKELLGAFLLLIFAVLVVLVLLLPDIARLYDLVRFSADLSTGLTFIGSLITAGFLFVFPLFLIRESLRNLGTARKLDQSGILTDAYIMDKWVEDSEGRYIFWVRYGYLERRSAIQTVSRDIFDRLAKGGSIKVLALPQFPGISRICPEK